MPMATKQEGYPVGAERAAAAVVEKSEAPVAETTPLKGKAKTLAPSGGTQPTVKDRSIINQTAFKCAAMMSQSLANFVGSADALEAKVFELAQKFEAKMLSKYEE